jgi:hypothetical protein
MHPLTAPIPRRLPEPVLPALVHQIGPLCGKSDTDTANHLDSGIGCSIFDSLDVSSIHLDHLCKLLLSETMGLPEPVHVLSEN